VKLRAAILTLSVSCFACASGPTDSRDRIIIAHRGASGYLPEHTLPAYALAYGMGADFIETDLVMTRDGVLVALHDIHLESTTNVEEVFPDRRRADGRWYAADFSLEEVKSLSAHERTNPEGEPALATRFRTDSKGFQVPMLVEVIELVQELNRITGRKVGIYPETKGPAFHDDEDLPMEEELLRILDEYGYRGPHARIFIQSFDPRNLVEMRTELGTDLPLIQLISSSDQQDELVTEAGLDRISKYANGIGPSKGRIASENGQNAAGSTLVDQAHARGLVVHPYTFRADAVPDSYQSFEAEVRRFFEDYGIDGLFTDHPDRAISALSPATLP